ncbi:YqgE/AlgH family protein [Halocynthiibacter sp. C4]|uniref:YqgE/AlgH family protein n=1 Tax=Halocynthiibacter sp. C4 TaxID=2992758 RepID=UPI00237BFA99|nr:YqgE/AlgH family protein [Halocynthiibacter sp. C4]MDE0590827.1 YqgE/AlgH family protein [Halocynthiibacter sp. C4]
MDIEDHSLCGKLLIAMPGMGDTRFDHSVIYLCAHSDEGSMGLIVNKPSLDIKIDTLLEQLDIPKGEQSSDIRVHFGGPVEHGRGFVLHSRDYDAGDSTLHVDDSFGMTATISILEDIAQGQGPRDALLALGYAGWGAGQLEGEILANGWLTADAEPELVFNMDNEEKWSAALETLGVSPLLLSSTSGNA